MPKENSLLSTGAKWVWRIGGNLGVVVGLIVAFSMGFLIKGFLGSDASVSVPQSAVHDHAELTENAVWTCIMHPQIQLPGPGQCPVCSMNLIRRPDGGSDEMSGKRRFTTTEAAKKLMKIQTSPVERRFAPAEIRMVGKLDYDETKLGFITAWVPGRIDRLYVDFTGIKVKKGDHMVYLYSPEVLTAQDELRRAAKTVEQLSPSTVEVIASTARSSLEAARQKLRRWGLTPEQIREAELNGISSDHITVYAPMGGTVIHRNGQEGMYVKEGTNIYTIADLSKVWLLLDAYESDLSWLHLGQTVEFTTEAYPGDTFTGKITFMDPMLDPTTRTVKVRVNVPNEDGRLKPEMFARAIVRAQVATGGRVMDPGLAGKWMGPMHPEIVKDGPGACDICGMALVKAEDLGYVAASANEEDMPLIIPASAPLLTGTRAIVYVEVPNQEKPTYEGREIVLGPRAGDYYIVRSGLTEGERVVTHGNFKIDSALQIMAKPSMMTPEGGGGGGHDHGGKMAKTKSADTGPMVMLSAAARDQFDQIIRVHKRLTETTTDAELKKALPDLGDALDGVDMSLLEGHAHMVWMEYSMRLRNDVFEAQGTTDPAKRKDALAQITDNVEKLSQQLGISADEVDGHGENHDSTPVELQSRLGNLYNKYLDLHAALARDNANAIPNAVKAAQEALSSVDMNLFAGKAHHTWMEYQAEIKDALSGMAESEEIKTVRVHMAALSGALSRTIESFGLISSKPVYKVHCPMAFGGDGADWLQSDKKILNPYFGEAMSSCGNVVGTIATSTPPNEHAHEQHVGTLERSQG